MSNTKIIQYVHRPNKTELGQANTHETYLLVDAKTDLSDVFPQGINTKVKDIKTGKFYDLKSSGGSEFRINQMGEFYRDYSVMPGDEITITHFETNGEDQNFISVKTFNRVVIYIDGKGVEIINIERLRDYLIGDREYSLSVNYLGKNATLKIAYLESKKKRSDSPTETDFYSISFDNEPLSKNTYYLTLGDYNELVCDRKSEYNKVIIDNFDGLNKLTSKKYDIILDFPLQQIFYGAPGTGKSYKTNEVAKKYSTIRTTFHPDSDYSTFVGAYKPTNNKEVRYGLNGSNTIAYKDPNDNSRELTESKIEYRFIKQAFLKAYINAWKLFSASSDMDNIEKQFLVIEEINRGNCAQIFGDLFQLLDRKYGFSEYPIEADEDIRKALLDIDTTENPSFGKDGLQLSDEKREFINDIFNKDNDEDSPYRDVASEIANGKVLVLPCNFYIWATMNTSDQSLFPIDSAFKRRWDWQYVPIFDGKKGWKIEVNGIYYDWWDFLQKINDKIGSTTNSEDKKLGYYFCKATNDIINAETFVSKVVFYIWNDVFKDFSEEADGLFKDDNGALSFNKFYTVNGEGKTMVVKEKIIRLLQNLGVKPIGQIEEKEIVNGESEEISDSIGGNGHKSIRSVVFPDGKVISTDNMTHFEVYLESLKKIGIETVYPVIAKMKYQRKGCPLISTEKLPGIINSNEYSYYQEGQYFIVKGASDDTLINILNDLNSKLDLGIIVNYE